MHVLFVHQALPAQFGPVAKWLSRSKEHRVTFVSADPRRRYGAVENIPYRYSLPPVPGTDRFWMGLYQRHLLHCGRVARAVQKRPDLKPDLIVGHSGFGPTLLLPEVLDCPIVRLLRVFHGF
jgi:hypothetical protein